MMTIYDIAKITGVSPATVSKVINNYPDVSDKTREKVLNAFKEHNFYPSAQAQFLTTKKSWTLGVVYYEGIGWGLKHPFFSGVIDGLKKRADEYGYSLLLGAKNNRLRNETFFDYFRHLKVDGIIIISSTIKDKDQINEIINGNIPVVLIDSESLISSVVISDNLKGCEIAINYLYDLGHRDIAHISGGEVSYTWTSNIRINGYITSMAKLGLKVREEYIVDGVNYRFDGGYEAMNKLLKLRKPPTAVFVAGDHMAIGAIKAIQDSGLRVPEDISVIGFDDIELSEYVTPKLTTIRQDTLQIGYAAIDVLVEQINKKKKFKKDVIVPVNLIERESCKKIK